jgi:hypothetical protein
MEVIDFGFDAKTYIYFFSEISKIKKKLLRSLEVVVG